MYQWVILPFVDQFSFLNVFRYITFRMGLCALTALMISIVCGPYVIRVLRALKLGQPIRKSECPPLHALHGHKEGTPTMGGVLFVFSTIVSCLMWANIHSTYVLVSMLGLILFAAIGFCDDYLKVSKKNPKGLSGKKKLFMQMIIALSIGTYLCWFSDISNIAKEIFIPFVKGALFENSPWIYLVFAVFFITGFSNAVNLTDGLDGLAIGCSIIAILTFTVISYIVGHKIFCDYLFLEYIPQAAELSVFCAGLAGGCLGFLWFNCHPAEVFMGDTGSLAIGGTLGLIAILVKKEIYLLLVGGVFVLETLSVMLQVGSFKLRGKRIFLCAPFHHHLEMKGWSETKVTTRLWILAVIFGVLGICSLKFR